MVWPIIEGSRILAFTLSRPPSNPGSRVSADGETPAGPGPARLARMKMRIVGLLVGLCLAPALSAQEPSAPAPTPGVSAAAPTTTYTLSPEKKEKAIAYAKARYRLHFVSFFWSVAVLVVILAPHLGPRFRDRAEAVSKRRFWQAAVFVPLLFVTQSIL